MITKNRYLRRMHTHPRAVAIPIHWTDNGYRVPLNLVVKPEQFWFRFLTALRQLTDPVR
jgi:hypothetical protein